MDVTLSTFIIQALHGLVYGMLLFLVASGLTLVFGMMDVLNIAHAAFYMLGAYLGSTLLAATASSTVRQTPNGTGSLLTRLAAGFDPLTEPASCGAAGLGTPIPSLFFISCDV